MHVESVDERDSPWEAPEPHFRVYLFDGGDEPNYAWRTRCYDVTDADAWEVLRWAADQAGAECLYGVALVGEDRFGQRGLTWLVGWDANSNPRDEDEQRWLAKMRERRADYTQEGRR